VPSSDPLRLSVPKRSVALAAGSAADAATARSILEYVRDASPPLQRIRRLEFAELPKTISGKIRAWSCARRRMSGRPAAGAEPRILEKTRGSQRSAGPSEDADR